MILSTPLHPLLVHFPIALLLFGVLAQFISLWKKDFFAQAATYLLTIGFIFALASYFTGEGAEEFAERQWGEGIEPMIETHETYAKVTLALFALTLIFKYFSRSVKALSILALVTGMAGAASLSLTGHSGGEMVYQIPGEIGTMGPADVDEQEKLQKEQEKQLEKQQKEQEKQQEKD